LGTEGTGVVKTGGVHRPGASILREKAVVQRRIRGKTEGKTKGNNLGFAVGAVLLQHGKDNK